METRKSVLDMDHIEFKRFLMKSSSYFSGDLPVYFNFQPILDAISDKFGSKPLNSCTKQQQNQVSNQENVNHVILSNKDGKLSWRPLELIHPLLYVNLVRELTKEKNWIKIKENFTEYQKNKNIECLSIPVESLTKKKDRAEQVSSWWENFELKSIEKAIDYDFMMETDISDCYSSIYTHSLAWAIETKKIAKEKRNDNTLGNFIDKSIKNMRSGQTNGIPQGSVLMDFIAEILLAYIDNELTIKLNALNINEYNILRYRDDYRVFVNNPSQGEIILKTLSECLSDIGLKLNSSKTKASDNVIISSVKEDKLAWISKRNRDHFLLKQVLIIKQHSMKHPNCGSLQTSLTEFNKRVFKLKKLDVSSKAIISIVIDIAIKNPKTQPVCFAIVSKIISLMNNIERDLLIDKLKIKFDKQLNIGYLEIWFQRAIKNHSGNIGYKEKLCNYIYDKKIEVWNSNWISDKAILKIMKEVHFVDQSLFSSSLPVIKSNEFDLFSTY